MPLRCAGSAASRSPASASARSRDRGLVVGLDRDRGFRPASTAASPAPFRGRGSRRRSASACASPAMPSIFSMCAAIFGARFLELGIILQVVIAIRHPQTALADDDGILRRIPGIQIDLKIDRARPRRSDSCAQSARELHSCPLIASIAANSASSGVNPRLSSRSSSMKLAYKIGELLRVGDRPSLPARPDRGAARRWCAAALRWCRAMYVNDPYAPLSAGS